MHRRLHIYRESPIRVPAWTLEEENAHQAALDSLDEELDRELFAFSPRLHSEKTVTEQANGLLPTLSSGYDFQKKPKRHNNVQSLDRTPPLQAQLRSPVGANPAASHLPRSESGRRSRVGPKDFPDGPEGAKQLAEAWANLPSGRVEWGRLYQKTLDCVVKAFEDETWGPSLLGEQGARCFEAASRLRMLLKRYKGAPTVLARPAEAQLLASTSYSAMIVDCGTSETKMLLYTFRDSDQAVLFEERLQMGPATDFLDTPSEFVTAVHRQIEEAEVDVSLVAASQWMRSAKGPDLAKGTALLNQCTSCGVLNRVLDSSYEAWMETVAVEYAAWKNEGLKLQGHWASGGGSTQLSRGFHEVHSLPLGSAAGAKQILQKGRDGATSWAKQVELAVQQFRAQRMLMRLTGRLLGMSAAYYAALAAGIPEKQPVPIKEVRERMEALIKRLMEALPDQPLAATEINEKQRGDDAKTLSNAILQLAVAKELMDDGTTVYFARDMGEYRVTWSCGWFLQMLAGCRKLTKFESRALRAFDAMQRQIDEVVVGMRQNTHDPMGWLKAHVRRGESRFTIAVDSSAGNAESLSALVLDCGTGESKVLLYQWEKTTGAIKMEERACLPPAQKQLDDPDLFVTQVHTAFEQCKADMALVAASQWMREGTPDVRTKGRALMHLCIRKGMAVKVLEPAYEAWMEAAAVEYASDRLKLGLVGSWASGSGSTQLSWDEFGRVQSVPLGNRQGVTLMREQVEEHGSIAEAAGVWMRQAEDLVGRFPEPLRGNVLGMSAAFYAAKAAGVPTREHVPVREVREAFRTRISALKRKLQEDRNGLLQGGAAMADTQTQFDKDLRELSNLIAQHALATHVMHDDTHVYFARDLKLENEPFRITWSCGWFLSMLHKQGHIEAPLRSLQTMANELEQSHEALQEKGLDKKCRTQVGRVLLSLDTIVDHLHQRAESQEKRVTQLLEEFRIQPHVTASDVRLEEGHRIKDKDAIRRKLEKELRKLVDENRHDPYFMPSERDIAGIVKDSLRYTIVVKRDMYTQVFREGYKYLTEKVGRVAANSFWHQESQYFGIVCIVSCPAGGAHSDGGHLAQPFEFEVVFHTEQSWRHTQTTFNVLKRVLDTLPPDRPGTQLYNYLKQSWRKEWIPTGLGTPAKAVVGPETEADKAEACQVPPPPEPLVDELLEQIDLVLAYQSEFLARCRARRASYQTESSMVKKDSKGRLLVTKEMAEKICGRIICSPEQPEFLGHPKKLLCWVGGEKLLNACLRFASQSSKELPALIADTIGYKVDEVTEMIANGHHFTLVVFPQIFCTRADWKGMLQMVQLEYPFLASTVRRTAKQLQDTPFETLQEELPDGRTFADILEKGVADPLYMDEDRLLNKVPPATACDVRGFLYNMVGANDLYRGDGYTYTAKDEKIDEEFLIRNQATKDITGAVLLPLGGPEKEDTAAAEGSAPRR